MAAIWIDGKFYDKGEAKISVYDHGLLYGDGLFEGIRIYAGKAFLLEAHLDRLFDGAKAIALEIPYPRPELSMIIEKVIAESGQSEGYIRLVVTRGPGDLGMSPWLCPRATVIVIVDRITLYPQELYETGISLAVCASRRISQNAFDVRVKSLNYLNNILAKIEAKQSGCLEAVLLNEQGYVAECSGDNIFIVKGGSLLTPSLGESILAGITRETVLTLAGERGIECREERLTRFDLYTADECFITGSGAEIMPVTKVDGRQIGSGRIGAMTEALCGDFYRFARS